MFTGIIQAIGTIVGTEATPRTRGGAPAHRLEIDLGELATGLELGASVAVNGACLTLATKRDHIAGFDVVPETWRRTTLQALKPGDAVNLERALRVGDPIDGHFVQGHVDGTGIVERVERGQPEWKLTVRTDAALLPFIVPKGSIAIDGTSLTVVDVTAAGFSVAIVPTTLERTTLGQRRVRDQVNLETDILARLVVSRLTTLSPAAASMAAESSALTLEKLRAGGYAP